MEKPGAIKPGEVRNPTGGSKLQKFRSDMIAKFEENKELFMAALDAEIKQNPMKAYKEYLAPFMPRMTEVSGEGGGPVPVIFNLGNNNPVS